MPLSAARIASDPLAPRALVMLHGIYGRGRNWQGIARTLVEQRPEYAFWLVDLPHHGESGPSRFGDTVRGLTSEVVDWLESKQLVPDAVLGHSYGGKVALAISEQLPATALQVWVVDSTPEARVTAGSAWQMLEIVRQLPPRFGSRDELVNAIVAGGFPVGVGQWMSTNLVRDESGFRWRLDFDAMERLLRDFFVTDLWRAVEHPAPGHELHFIKASDSSAMSDAAVARIQALAHPRVHLHLVEGGHWIHAEQPDVVSGLLLANLR